MSTIIIISIEIVSNQHLFSFVIFYFSHVSLRRSQVATQILIENKNTIKKKHH